MAFFTKNSHAFVFLLRKTRYCDLDRAVILSQFAKFSSNSYANSSVFNNNSSRTKSKLFFTKQHLNNPFVLPTISALHFMSTDSNVTTPGLQQIVNSSEGLISTNTHNQVLFTNESIPNSTREIIEPLTTNLPADISTIVDVVEPTFFSLGLGCPYTPVGLIQLLLESLHVSVHLPWWLSIVIVTAIVRTFMMPIFIKTQRNAAKLSNYMPRMTYLQNKFNESRKSGNAFESSKHANELMSFMKEHNINPLKNAIWPLVQAPVFLSFFWALRAMAKLPVESMKVGGFSWISDLTIPDPYYIMPLVASATLYVILKVGAESGVRMENLKLSRYFLMALPVIIFPFCMNFPAAVLFYWCSNNFITLGLVSLIKLDPVRMYFGISKIKKSDILFSGDKPKKNFVSAVKDSFEDHKILSAIEARDRNDAIRFKKAGTGPIPRTYAYDPTKPRPGIAAATAAKAAGRTDSSKIQ